MKQTKTVLLDDIDGSPAARTVTFSFNKTTYEIDLSDAHAKELVEDLEKWTSNARQVGRKSGTTRSARRSGGNPESAAIRAWAQSNGLGVSDRGRIPSDIVKKYHAEHN